MEHLDWLHPDHIILSNSSNASIYKEFTRNMRSRQYSRLRLLNLPNDSNRTFIRYVINNSPVWYECKVFTQKNKDYYISVFYPNTKEYIDSLEKMYTKFNREDNLNELLK